MAQVLPGATVSPHAPRRGRMGRLLGRFHVTGVFWYRFHAFGATLPAWLQAPLLHLFAGFFFLALRRIRNALASNLAAVLGRSSWLEGQRRAWRTLLSFSWCLTERYERLCTDHACSVTLEGEDTWRSLNASPRGFILATAHVGLWEVGSMLPSAVEERHVHVVREGEMDPRAQEYLSNLLRQRMPSTRYTTHFATGDPALGVALLDALRRGEIVALQADRPRARSRTVPATLFGRPVDLPAGPAALARAAGVDLVPAFVLRLGRRRYRVIVREPVPVPVTSDRQADVELATQRLAAHIEWAIGQDPYQWFCFSRLWP
jgi:lauroyl/myristoyl acyltransferase